MSTWVAALMTSSGAGAGSGVADEQPVNGKQRRGSKAAARRGIAFLEAGATGSPLGSLCWRFTCGER
ncbi:hypothetical protein AB0C93_05225 [Streptomyces sp. NPDC048518]|uniref:hypothetical protein n=1 Tax=Streptomyces sp. NPDC048518 TaxID=3155029 RepID=UPI00340D117C